MSWHFTGICPPPRAAHQAAGESAGGLEEAAEVDVAAGVDAVGRVVANVAVAIEAPGIRGVGNQRRAGFGDSVRR